LFDAVLQSEQLPAFLAAILTSRTFGKSPTLCNLLVYLWENRDGRISEYAIATEALGRSSDFDSKIDATVRVQISPVCASGWRDIIARKVLPAPSASQFHWAATESRSTWRGANR